MPQLYSTHVKKSSRGRFPNRSSGKGQVKSSTLGKIYFKRENCKGLFLYASNSRSLFCTFLKLKTKKTILMLVLDVITPLDYFLWDGCGDLCAQNFYSYGTLF